MKLLSWLLLSCAIAVAAATGSEIFRGDPELVQRWLAEGGYQLTGSENLAQFRHKVIMRAQHHLVDVLTAHGRTPFDSQGKKLTSKEYPYFAFIPPYAASLIPGGPAMNWSAPCFQSNTGVAMSNPDGSWTINITASDPVSWLCSDSYLITTLEGVKFEILFSQGTHSITWTVPSTITEAQLWDINNKGFRVFTFLDNFLQTLDDVLATLLLFGSELTQGVPQWVADYNVDFMARYAGRNMTVRNTTTVSIDESTINSGDFFGVIRLDGLDPMLGWAMGSTTGHTVVALRIDGELYIAESTVKDSYWPTDGIQKTPYQQWLVQARAAGYSVVHAPLSAKYAAKFNITSALERFNEIEGFEYGYRNLLYGWLDTIKDNYPCLPPDYTQCLEWQHVEVIMTAFERLVPQFADMIFGQAFNIRLGTTGLKAADLFYYADQKGIDVETIPTIVEEDTFVYNTTRYNVSTPGPSMVCCVFVCNMWKAGGMFDEIDNELNCAELTNWDDYALTILDTTTPRPPQCVQADPNNNLCQIEGEYTLVLNDYATKNMYPHMAEKCPSLAPNYNKPANC